MLLSATRALTRLHNKVTALHIIWGSVTSYAVLGIVMKGSRAMPSLVL